MLYVLNKYYCVDELETYLLRAGPQSSMLFVEDAVYLAKSGSQSAISINKHWRGVAVYTLVSDLAARGLTEEDIGPGIQAIDYDEFVDLTVDNKDLQFWF